MFANENLAGSYQAYNSMIYGARLSTGMPLNDQLGMNWTYSIYNQGLSLDPALGTASLPNSTGGGRRSAMGVVDRQRAHLFDC